MTPCPAASFKLATYNIHKGVLGLGPMRRLELQNQRAGLGLLNADVVCLQEVRGFNHRLAKRFAQWPSTDQGQALAAEGYASIYKTNAVTRHGEHGNAVLSRWPATLVGHYDVSDHRLEQRGLLHVAVHSPQGVFHVINVHLGLIAASRRRQVQHLLRIVNDHVPPKMPLVVAGDFNDWAQQLHTPLAHAGLHTISGHGLHTFPSRMPRLSMDRIYARGLRLLHASVPSAKGWQRWSDHLPLLMEIEMGTEIGMDGEMDGEMEGGMETEKKTARQIAVDTAAEAGR